MDVCTGIMWPACCQALPVHLHCLVRLDEPEMTPPLASADISIHEDLFTPGGLLLRVKAYNIFPKRKLFKAINILWCYTAYSVLIPSETHWLVHIKSLWLFWFLCFFFSFFSFCLYVLENIILSQAAQQEGAWFNSQSGSVLCGVCMFSLVLSRGIPVSSYSPKTFCWLETLNCP